MSIKITCINKDNGDHDDPHEAIEYLGWINESTNESGKWSRSKMVQYLESGRSAYVSGTIKKVFLEVRTSRYRNKYVRTIPDNVESNNLLRLPEC